MYKRTIKCYQCKNEKTDLCISCDDDYNNFKFLPEYNRRLIHKGKVMVNE